MDLTKRRTRVLSQDITKQEKHARRKAE